MRGNCYHNLRKTNNQYSNNEKFFYEQLKSTIENQKSEPENNKILYQSTNGEIVTPKFFKKVRRNQYKNGVGVLTFTENITQIPANAFSDSTNLKSITLPQSVEEIGNNAFARCPNLTTFSGKFASEDGRNLIVENRLVAIAPYGIITFQIPDEVTEIQSYTFSYCQKLESIILPKNIRKIQSYTFVNCANLQSVTIPETVRRVESKAFINCPSMKFSGRLSSEDGRSLIINKRLVSFVSRGVTEYIIPKGIKEIDNSAFSMCKTLQRITIPKSVTRIGEMAFYWCESLKTVTLPEELEILGKSALKVVQAYHPSQFSVR